MPMERIGVLIGHNGETKKDLEEKSGIKISIDSKTGDINFDENNSADPLMILKVENIINAISTKVCLLRKRFYFLVMNQIFLHLNLKTMQAKVILK